METNINITDKLGDKSSSNREEISMEENTSTTENTTSDDGTTKVDDKFSYLKDIATVAELQEEMVTFAKDLRDAEFVCTLDIVRGVKEGFSSTMQVMQDLIERLEEHSPDPNNDTLISSMYAVYDALSDLKKKCDYL